MKVDGDSVNIGDRLWHDRYGWGTVTHISTGVCHMRFADANNEVIFTEGGKSNGYKVLWWGPPIKIVPRKGVSYDGIQEVVSAIVKLATGGV